MKDVYKMDAKDREILNAIANAFSSVKELSDRLFMSESTVRRRLSDLERSGLIIRTYGGAVLNQSHQRNKNLPLYLREMQMGKEKNEIAGKAVRLISDGDTVFIDTSSTVLFLLPYLIGRKQLTLCTNSLRAATVLSEMEIPCTFFGGDVVPGELACSSEETYEMIGRICADWFFFSCDALSEDGRLTDQSKRNCYLRKAYMKAAKKSVLLIDETKLNKRCTYLLDDLAQIDYCVCNRSLPKRLMDDAPNTVFI